MRFCNQNLPIPEGLNQKEPKRSKSEAPFQADRISRADTPSTYSDAHVNTLFIPEAQVGGLCVICFEVWRRLSKGGPLMAHSANSYWLRTASLMKPFAE